MAAYETEFFSMNDINRLRISQDVINRRLTTRLAATRLEISDRHCRRLLVRYRENGPLSLVNRRRGQPGNRQLISGLAEQALHIIRKHYADFGQTLACENLAVSGQRDGTQADDTAWFTDPSKVTATSSTSTTTASGLHRRTHPE